MKKFFAVLPFPILLSLYACASSGVEDEDLGNKPVGTTDAGEDAAPPKKDSGPATPAKDSGTGSSSGDAGRDSGTSSSSGGTSSSSGGGNAAACSGDDKTAYGTIIAATLAGGTLPPGIEEVDSCSECTVSADGCCATYDLIPRGTFCIDLTAGLPTP